MSGVVVGYDGSTCSDAVLRWAVHEAKLRDAQLLVISAVAKRLVPEPKSSTVLVDPPDWEVSAARDRADAALSKVAAEIGAAEMPEVQVSVPIGNAAALLVAASRDAELLVVGATGHNLWIELLLGSVSTAVTHHAHCPVTVVRS